MRGWNRLPQRRKAAKGFLWINFAVYISPLKKISDDVLYKCATPARTPVRKIYFAGDVHPGGSMKMNSVILPGKKIFNINLPYST